MVDFPIASPTDCLDDVWQYMAKGTFVAANEEFVEEFRVFGEPWLVSEPSNMLDCRLTH